MVSQKRAQSRKLIQDAQHIQHQNETHVLKMQSTLAKSYEPCIAVTSKLAALHESKQQHEKIIAYA